MQAVAQTAAPSVRLKAIAACHRTSSIGARHNLLIKDAATLEGIGELDAIAFDKTGTLTEGEPALTNVITNGEFAEAVGVLRLPWTPESFGSGGRPPRSELASLGGGVWPLCDLQGYMGHANIETTMIYVHHVPKAEAADQLTQAVVAATGPAAADHVTSSPTPS